MSCIVIISILLLKYVNYHLSLGALITVKISLLPFSLFPFAKFRNFLLNFQNLIDTFAAHYLAIHNIIIIVQIIRQTFSYAA